MSDCLIDFRPPDQRRCDLAAERLRFFPDIEVLRFDEAAFSLVLTRSDSLSLWGPYRDPDTSVLVALVGRIAMEESEWQKAEALPHSGGLACKAVHTQYQQRGLDGFKDLNGNFLTIISDPRNQKVHLITDRCGMVPLFKAVEMPPVFSTHPDLLADVTGSKGNLDETSLSEFLATGKVSFPFTYYRNISAADFGSSYTVSLRGKRPALQESTRYFDLQFQIDESNDRGVLAERLAAAFKGAVRRRTLSRFGKTTIALSGGLDSRMILCACPQEVNVSAICFFDEQNQEFNTARAIAAARGISLTPIRRDPEHYGAAAELGVKIYGGMASFASNHFLGFRDQMMQSGLENLLTGCYCDYFFKALALNRKVNRITRSETPGVFSHEYYRPLFFLESTPGKAARERLDQLFDPSLKRNASPQSLLNLEAKRLFPISYEADSPQRLVPQRVLPWYVPIVDNDVLDVYLATPPHLKFNTALFSEMVQSVCGPTISRIPDSNTGARINASGPEVLLHMYARGLRNRAARLLNPRLATSGSWPNWEYYVHHSEVLRRLWTRNGSAAPEVLQSLIGFDPFARPVESYTGRDAELFVRLLTLKIWFEVNHS